MLEVRGNLSSLPKELGGLSGLTVLCLPINCPRGNLPQTLPDELGKLKPLEFLDLRGCDLDAIPSFVGELESLSRNSTTRKRILFRVDATTLDFLVGWLPHP